MVEQNKGGGCCVACVRKLAGVEPRQPHTRTALQRLALLRTRRSSTNGVNAYSHQHVLKHGQVVWLLGGCVVAVRGKVDVLCPTHWLWHRTTGSGPWALLRLARRLRLRWCCSGVLRVPPSLLPPRRHSCSRGRPPPSPLFLRGGPRKGCMMYTAHPASGKMGWASSVYFHEQQGHASVKTGYCVVWGRGWRPFEALARVAKLVFATPTSWMKGSRQSCVTPFLSGTARHGRVRRHVSDLRAKHDVNAMGAWVCEM